MTHNGYRYAELARGESLCSPDTCGHCGRTNLKKTIKLITPTGSAVWFGVGCAARAMGVGLKEVKAAKASAEAALAFQLRSARMDEDRKEEAVWQAFLDRHAPAQHGNRFKQIEAMGGWSVARPLYISECATELASLESQRQA